MEKYAIIEGYTLEKLKFRVNKAISKGYIPIGGFIIDKDDDYYKQTMFNPNIKLESTDIQYNTYE